MSKYIAKLPDQNNIIHFSPHEHKTWQLLFDRQKEVIKDRACDEFIHGLAKLNYSAERIPQCPEVSAVLQSTTGWSAVPVAAMIPLSEFFSLLANRQFPVASFIRLREELDYLKEPDIFHELFGHCPLLTHPAYADFVQWYGEMALRTSREVQSLLGRLFWFTIEFGLIKTPKGLRIYGGGILSSFVETTYALESDAPERLPFDIQQILQSPYRYDEIQTRYYVLENLGQLFQLKTDQIFQWVEAAILHTESGRDFVIC
ncbi:MAG TPA: phenylalanine 4-monooxygenase [Gammaproteobacteria bacterium]|nr:phenylalanine 4-monooxygenase [Gammaproteobacteria bacterium]